jgi:hypothetical protein
MDEDELTPEDLAELGMTRGEFVQWKAQMTVITNMLGNFISELEELDPPKET